MKKYWIILDGKPIRCCADLKKLLCSEVYKPWYSGCKVFEFTYNSSGLPINAMEVNQ